MLRPEPAPRKAVVSVCDHCHRDVDSKETHYSHEGVLLHYPGCFFERIVQMYKGVQTLFAMMQPDALPLKSAEPSSRG